MFLNFSGWNFGDERGILQEFWSEFLWTVADAFSYWNQIGSENQKTLLFRIEKKISFQDGWLVATYSIYIALVLFKLTENSNKTLTIKSSVTSLSLLICKTYSTVLRSPLVQTHFRFFFKVQRLWPSSSILNALWYTVGGS